MSYGHTPGSPTKKGLVPNSDVCGVPEKYLYIDMVGSKSIETMAFYICTVDHNQD